MFALIFWTHVTIFCIFWLHECLKWILEFNSKSLFWCQSRQIFEVRAIEQRHHEFQLIHMPPHQFWPRYHSDGLSPVHVRFEFFPKEICNVEALICHFYKNIKTLTQIHFPRDAHIFRTCTIFYRHYKGLHQMRKDLVLCALYNRYIFTHFSSIWVIQIPRLHHGISSLTKIWTGMHFRNWRRLMCEIYRRWYKSLWNMKECHTSCYFSVIFFNIVCHQYHKFATNDFIQYLTLQKPADKSHRNYRKRCIATVKECE